MPSLFVQPLAVEEREIRLEVGYCLKGTLTYGKNGKILDDNLAYLSNNLFDAGLQEIFRDTTTEINNEYHYEIEASSTPVVTETPISSVDRSSKFLLL